MHQTATEQCLKVVIGKRRKARTTRSCTASRSPMNPTRTKMRRRNSTFPVSSPQGVGSRETATHSLISNDLSLPSRVFHQSAAGKPISGASAPGPLVGVQRRFQPDEVALNELADALYALLVDPTVAQLDAEAKRPEPTCFSDARE